MKGLSAATVPKNQRRPRPLADLLAQAQAPGTMGGDRNHGTVDQPRLRAHPGITSTNGSESDALGKDA